MRDTMAKIGRNDPCPCGSGNKYKRCCLQAQASTPQTPPTVSAADPIDDDFCDCCIDRLNDQADRAMELLVKGHVDEAEPICLQLMRDFPREVEGVDILSMIYEARGQRERAAELQRQAIDIARSNPHVEDETRVMMHQRLQMLERPAA